MWASEAIIWASLPRYMSAGTTILQETSSLAEYAARDAPWFPLVAHTTESKPFPTASEIIRAADLSLKEFVGFRVSSFRCRFLSPRCSSSLSAFRNGVPPPRG